MLSNAYFLAKFRFDTAENEPAKKLQNFRKMHFSKMHFSIQRAGRSRAGAEGARGRSDMNAIDSVVSVVANEQARLEARRCHAE